MKEHPSLLKILKIDYLAFLGLWFPIIIWAIYIVLLLLNKTNPSDTGLLIAYAVITVLGILVLGWRIQLYYSVFDDGIEAMATISNISFFRDRGRIDYAYLFQGQKFMSGNAVMKTKETRSIQIGDQVVLVVDRNHPKRAFIRDLFLKG